jgi:hypothetical protein
MNTTSRVLVVLTLIIGGPAHAFDITECFQSVPAGETGRLMADLDCGEPPEPAPNVYLGIGADLELNGHTISGGLFGVLNNASYVLSRITGPGTITNARGPGPDGGCGIQASSPMRIENVDIVDNDCGIQRIYNHAMVLKDVSIADNTRNGLYSTLPGPGGGKLRGTDVSVTGNGGVGIANAGKTLLSGATVSDNVSAGLVMGERRSRIIGSQLHGNGAGGDIAANRAPRMVDSSCDVSIDLDDGGTLGICTND